MKVKIIIGYIVFCIVALLVVRYFTKDVTFQLSTGIMLMSLGLLLGRITRGD